jgi:AcrR family transcriptional regulator
MTIIDACRAELHRVGYAGLTIRAVAERAAVSQETIYKTFGGKRGMVKALYDVTLAGDDQPIPMAERPEIRDLLAEPDPHAKVRAYARLARQISERVGDVLALLGAGGPEAAGITAQTDRERLAGTTAFARHLADRGLLRTDPASAADACWILTSPQLYRLCTAGRGWSHERYERWLGDMMSAALLAP